MILIGAVSVILLIVLSNVLFWPGLRDVDRLPRAAGKTASTVSVLIPARNEAANIAACLESVAKQGEMIREVLVYDDHSVDGTARLVESAARSDERIRLVKTNPLPPGWCGKNFACDQLARAASGEWLLFLDADARLLHSSLARIVAEAQQRDLTLLSCWPGFQLSRFTEALLMPLLNFVVFSIFPGTLSLVRGDASLGLAHGACILTRKNAYWRVGGHAAVANEIFEDTRLAQLWRVHGERSLCLDGQDVVRVRMYTGFFEIWRGFQKNFYPAFRTEWLFWFFLLFHFCFFLLPFLIGNWGAAGLVIASRLLLALRFAHPWWSALLHPFGEAVLLALGISSWWQCRSGRGVTWKDRLYRASRV